MGNDSSKSSAKGSQGHGGISSSLGLKSGPSSSTVQKHIDTAKKSRVLQLKNCGLKKVPDALNELSDVIRNLELSQNKIHELPPFIGKFNQLKQLHLSDNCLETLPDELGCLKSLEVLNLHNNNLSSLPSTLVACIALKNVTISSNSFTTFPIVACHMIALDNINLSGNKITELPEEISDCRASEINLNQNRLSLLRADHLAKCERLRILRVEENCLAKTEFTESLLADTTLAIISYSGNMFQEKEFQDLNGYEGYQDRFTATKRKM